MAAMKDFLDDDTIHLYVWRLDDVDCDEATLDATERARAARLTRAEVRRRFVAARATLRRVLAIYQGADASELSFAYGPHGKPELAGRSDLAFNLSHSGEKAVLAVGSEISIGVDVERIRSDLRWEGVADRFFGPDERRVLRSAPAQDRVATFFRLWTVREAYLKARGVGFDALGAEMPQLLRDASPSTGGGAVAWRCVEPGVADGDAAAIVWRGSSRSIRRLDVPARRAVC